MAQTSILSFPAILTQYIQSFKILGAWILFFYNFSRSFFPGAFFSHELTMADDALVKKLSDEKRLENQSETSISFSNLANELQGNWVRFDLQ